MSIVDVSCNIKLLFEVFAERCEGVSPGEIGVPMEEGFVESGER